MSSLSRPLSADCVCDLDVTRDGSIANDDYELLQSCLNDPASGPCETSDLDCNGIVDLFDLYRLYCSECTDSIGQDCCAPATATMARGGCVTSASGAGDVCVGGFNAGVTCTLPHHCSSGVCGLKNRFVSFQPNQDPWALAYRVKLLTLDKFPDSEREVKWLTPPQEYLDPVTNQFFWASEASCTPHLVTWTGISVLYVFGSAIVPDSIYEIRAIPESCLGSGQEMCSYYPLIVGTGKWGDVVAPFAPTQNQPNFLDIAAIVDAFQARTGAPPVPRSRLNGNVADPDVPVGFLDISATVSGFQGKPFAFSGPEPCP